MNQNKLKPCNCFLCKPKRLTGIEFSKYYGNDGTKEHLLPWSFPKSLNNYYKEFNKKHQIEINKIDGYENVIIHEGNIGPLQFIEQIIQAEKKAEIATKERVDNFVIETIKKHFE